MTKRDDVLKLIEENAYKEADQLGYKHLGKTSLYNIGWEHGYHDASNPLHLTNNSFWKNFWFGFNPANWVEVWKQNYKNLK